MRAVIFSDEKKLDNLDIDNNLPDEKGIVLSVIASGICGTDLHIIEGEGNLCGNVILGHEFYGSIDKIEAGSKVQCLKW